MTVQNPVADRLDAVRAFMAGQEISALIVPTGDVHMSEYVAEELNLRRYLSGFTGSAGKLLVTSGKSFLWTDSRYWIQAERQLAGSGIRLMKEGHPDTPKMEALIAAECPENSTVGIDGSIVTADAYFRLQHELEAYGIWLKSCDGCLDALWPDHDRVVPPDVSLLDTGAPFARADENLAATRGELAKSGCSAAFISTMDDIAWICNLRNFDRKVTTPVFPSYLAITESESVLFVEKLPGEEFRAEYLAKTGIRFAPYENALNESLGMLSGKQVLLDPKRTTAAMLLAFEHAGIELCEKMLPSVLLKSRKSEYDLANFRRAMHLDGLAMCKALCRIEEESRSPAGVTEVRAAEIIDESRFEHGAVALSFDTISAFGANAAEPHYTPGVSGNAKIEGDSMLLIDSGGQYPGATTDITRVVPVGNPSREMKRDYTAVLQGHIGIATARFPDGLHAAMIDTLARLPIWKIGTDYGHGTGHGVGSMLSVHEGPVSISPRARMDESGRIRKGLVISNEPGIYRQNRWGIRIENLVAASDSPARPDEEGGFLEFETLTLCPIDTRLVLPEMLSEQEKIWINGYNDRVRTELYKELDEKTKAWFDKSCARI